MKSEKSKLKRKLKANEKKLLKIGENITKVGHWGILRNRFKSEKIITFVDNKQLALF